MSHSDKYFLLSDYPMMFRARGVATGGIYTPFVYSIWMYTGKKWIPTHDGRAVYGDISDWTKERGLEIVAIVRIIPKTV